MSDEKDGFGHRLPHAVRTTLYLKPTVVARLQELGAVVSAWLGREAGPSVIIGMLAEHGGEALKDRIRAMMVDKAAALDEAAEDLRAKADALGKRR